MLALVTRFKWLHTGYLKALGQRVSLTVGFCDEVHPGSVLDARREGVDVVHLPPSRRALERLIDGSSPDVIHTLYYHHEELTLLARELAPETVLVYECRDPLSTLDRAPGSRADRQSLERTALEASDGQLFVSDALRAYLDRLHDLDLGPSSIVVPHGFALDTLAAPADKLSLRDGETHIALVGTASDEPGHSRYYPEIIEWLTGLGFVVHSHFFCSGPEAEPYRRLARRNQRYHRHTTISPLRGTELSRAISRYDLMGVFHDLAPSHHSETDTLAVCMPTKAVSGWFHGGIPVVCSRHYRGLTELIDEHGIGFAYDDEPQLAALVGAGPMIRSATERTLALRARFSHEWSAGRIEPFLQQLVGVRV